MKYVKTVRMTRCLDIVARDYEELRSMWKDLPPCARKFRVRSIAIEKPITLSQMGRLPNLIKNRLVKYSTVDSIAFCEALYRLEDLRD